MRDFTVKDFFKAILDHIVVFVLIPFIAVAVTAFISSNVLPPVYTAKTSLYVMNQASDTITSSDVNTSTLSVSYTHLLFHANYVHNSIFFMRDLIPLA